MQNADKSRYLLSLALGKDFADRTSKMPLAAPGSKEDRLLDTARARGTKNSPGRS